MFTVLLLMISTLKPQEAPSAAKNQFIHSRSTAIHRPVMSGSPAERIAGFVTSDNLPYAFVAEDGSAIGVYLGPMTKLDVKSGSIIAENDKYNVEIRDGKFTAFNVSQEKWIRKSYKGAVDVSLKPLILLDRYRTLCTNGALSARAVVNPKVPKHKLFLALIDDRQRGPRPNQVRAIDVREEIGTTGISVVGSRSGRYILRLHFVKSGVRFLSIDPNNLDSRWVKSPGWSGFAADIQAIRKKTPGFNPLVSARWASKSYFLAPAEGGADEVGYVWNGAALKTTGPLYLVASSFNQRYAWLVDRNSGHQWLLNR